MIKKLKFYLNVCGWRKSETQNKFFTKFKILRSLVPTKGRYKAFILGQGPAIVFSVGFCGDCFIETYFKGLQ